MTISRVCARLGLFAGLAAVAPACETTLSGEEGNFTFSYAADDDPLDTGKPLAAGAKLQLRVAQAGTNRTVEVTQATSDDASVMKVHSFSGNRVIVQGVADGGARLDVRGNVSNGTEQADHITLQVREAKKLVLSHACATGETAAYPVDVDAAVVYELQLASGQPVVGYGYWPVTLAPEDGLALDQTSTSQQFMVFRTGTTPGDVTMTSTIDDAALTLRLVELSAIDGAAFHRISTRQVKVDGTSVVNVVPTVGDLAVCGALTQVAVTNDSPEVCDVTPTGTAPESEDTPTNSFGWVTVKGKEVGTCAFTISWPDANAQASGSLSIDVVEATTP